MKQASTVYIGIAKYATMILSLFTADVFINRLREKKIDQKHFKLIENETRYQMI